MDSNERYVKYRKNRIKRFKAVIIFMMFMLLIIPNVLSVYLFMNIKELQSSINNLNAEVENIKNTEVEINENTELQIEETKDTNKQQVVYRTLTDKEAYPGYQRIYLTFDDGPSKNTDEILDILNEYGAKATFFVLKKDGFDDKYKRIVNEGHSLGIHSDTHDYSVIYSSPEKFEIDVNSVYNFISDLTSVKPVLYRFPGGSSNTIYKGDKQDLISIIDKTGLRYYDWNVASNDSVNGGLAKEQITNNVIKGIGDKEDAFVLLHDTQDKYSTVEALRMILDSYSNKDNVIFLPVTEFTEPCEHVTRK